MAAMSTLERSDIQPFGLTLAVPARPVNPQDLGPALALDPALQINVTEDGRPFIFEPSMKTSLTTQQQTQEDSQLDTSTENDTD
ncbi:putative ATP-grasp-modified RiPP [Streptomyces sp. NPDC059506]|uniref:putative ATP-grasp-modified RiPP n=1 Tax=Streptomyces TaxID=1883 RepID=UPI0036B34A7B